MRSRNHILALAALPLTLPAHAQPANHIELTLQDRTVPIIINGRSVTVEVAPDGSGSPIINAAVAEDIGFKGSMVAGLHLVGKTRVKADSNLARVDFGDGKANKRRVFWFERDWTSIAEGRIGPLALTQDVVTYRLRPTSTGERIIELPMETHERAGIWTTMKLDDQEIRLAFTVDRQETMMTASSGALLSAEFDGRMEGDPFPLMLEMNIERPVRNLTFGQPVMVGDLRLSDLVVRTADTGSTSAIPDKDRDPAEIVVTGKKKKRARHGVWIGLDSLSHCSTLTFDKPAEIIRLSCLPDTA